MKTIITLIILASLTACQMSDIDVPIKVLNMNAYQYYQGHMDGLNYMVALIANYDSVPVHMYANKFHDGEPPENAYEWGAHDALIAHQRYGIFHMP
jgi:hypothetical protein